MASFKLASPGEMSSLGHDPIGCDVSLPLQAVFHPLGFPVEVATNCADVLMAAEANWKLFQKAFPSPALQLRIAVSESQDNQRLLPPTCRGQRNLVMFVAGPQDFAVCDLTAGLASCWLTSTTVQDSAYLRYHFLDAMALLLVEALYLTPVHAACVVFQGRGVLLCGESGAGKSSLSFACARRGWTFVSDDASFLVRGRNHRVVVGNPHCLHLRESAKELFPDLRTQSLVPRTNGELAFELPTATIPAVLTAPQAPVDFLVFLNRQPSGPASLRPYSKELARRSLEHVVCYGELEVRNAQKASLRDLLATKVLELRYSDLDRAVSLLELMTSETAGFV